MRDAIIDIQCAYTERLQFVYEESCEYLFVWETPLACTPPKDVQCVAFDIASSTVYDVSPLSLAKSSYSFNGNGEIYNINLCNSVFNADCDPSAGVCVTHPDGTTSNLGLYDTAKLRVVSSGVVTITYTNGEECSSSSSSTAASIVTMTCDPHAFHELPKLLHVNTTGDQCTYSFSWSTCYACAGGCAGLATTPSTTTTTRPKHEPTTSFNAFGNDDINSNSNSNTTSRSSSHVGLILLVLIMILIGGVAFIILHNPSRRGRLVSLFERQAAPPRFQYKKTFDSLADEDDDDVVSSNDDEDEDDEEASAGRKREVLVALTRK